MFDVTSPDKMNETFARAFNSRVIENLLCLYEEGAILVGESNAFAQGITDIGVQLCELLKIPGSIVSTNNFCLVQGDIALLRADWSMFDPAGVEIFGASSAEIVRRQPDGRWLYVIDHALGASVPSVRPLA